MRVGSTFHSRALVHQLQRALRVLQWACRLVAHVLVAGGSIFHDERRNPVCIQLLRDIEALFHDRYASITAAGQDDDRCARAARSCERVRVQLRTRNVLIEGIRVLGVPQRLLICRLYRVRNLTRIERQRLLR